jgi:hypothetical protein
MDIHKKKQRNMASGMKKFFQMYKALDDYSKKDEVFRQEFGKHSFGNASPEDVREMWRKFRDK